MKFFYGTASFFFVGLTVRVVRKDKYIDILEYVHSVGWTPSTIKMYKTVFLSATPSNFNNYSNC